MCVCVCCRLTVLVLGTLKGKFEEEKGEECTLDGTVDWKGQPAIKGRTGQWVAGTIILCKLSLFME